MPGGCPNFANYLNDVYSLPNALLEQFHTACIEGGLQSARQGETALKVMRAFWVTDFITWCSQGQSVEVFDYLELLGHHDAEVKKLQVPPRYVAGTSTHAEA